MTIDVEQRLRRAADVLDEHLTAPAKSPYVVDVDFRNDRLATPRSRRAGLGVAALALGTLVVVAVVNAIGDGHDKVVTPVSVPTITEPAPTTSTVVRSPDQKIADAILLPKAEYSADWQQVNVADVTMNVDIAGSVPACAPYVDVVFESSKRPAAVAFRWFETMLKANANAMEYVVVLPDDTAAKAMFDAMQEPAFNDGCLHGYLADPRFKDLPGDLPLRPSTFELPDLALPGDQVALRSYEDGATPIYGPDRYLSAAVRVGRTITVIETITKDSEGNDVMPLAQFWTIVANVVNRAPTALSASP